MQALAGSLRARGGEWAGQGCGGRGCRLWRVWDAQGSLGKAGKEVQHIWGHPPLVLVPGDLWVCCPYAHFLPPLMLTLGCRGKVEQLFAKFEQPDMRFIRRAQYGAIQMRDTLNKHFNHEPE